MKKVFFLSASSQGLLLLISSKGNLDKVLLFPLSPHKVCQNRFQTNQKAISYVSSHTESF